MQLGGAGISIDVTSNVAAFARHLDIFQRQQLPFAIAQALNDVMAQVKTAEQENEEKVLDRPRPFTKNALRIIKASKGASRLVARMVMMDLTAAYLDPYDKGGVNKLNQGTDHVFTPVGSAKELDKYGNLPRRLTAKMMARKDVFIGEVKTKDGGTVLGMWQRTSAEGSKVGVLRKKRDGTAYTGKTGRNLNTSGKLKLLIRFDDPHPIADKNRLHWQEVARDTVGRQFNAAMARALDRALKTAK